MNIAEDGEPAHQIVESDRERGENAEQAIEMRTARDAKAVPSSGGRNDPLESHLTGEQLANLTLEDHLLLERRIKVAHTNLNQKNAQKKTDKQIFECRSEKEFQVWNEPSESEKSFSSSSSESSPTCPIVPWDPASMTPLKVKVQMGKK